MTAVSAQSAYAERKLFRRVALPTWVAAIVTGVSLVLLSVLAVADTVGSVVALGIALLMLGLICVGLERTGEAFVILGVFLVTMTKFHSPGALSFVSAADAAMAVGFMLMFPDLIRRPLRLPATFAVGAIGVFFAAVISSLLSEDPLISLNATTRLVVGSFGLTILVAWWSPGLKKVVVIVWAYVLSNVANAFYASITGVQPNGRRSGLAEHPNFMGMCALLAIVLIPFLLTQTPRQRRWIPVAAGLVCLWGLWTSGSRAALAALIVVIVVYPLLSRSVIAGLGLLTTFAVGVVFSQQLVNAAGSESALGRLIGKGTTSSSDESREEIAVATLEQFMSHPILGVGLVHPLQAHIIYLQVMAGLGMVGLLLFLLAGSVMIRPLVMLKPPYSLLALPVLAYAVAGLVSNLLWDRYIWITLALAVLAPRLAADEPPDDQSPATGTPAATARAPTRAVGPQP
jgi:hypothetical protein